MLEFFNFILVLFYVFAWLNVIRHFYYLLQAWIRSESEEPIQYMLTPNQLFLLGLSLSYVITGILCGITF